LYEPRKGIKLGNPRLRLLEVAENDMRELKGKWGKRQIREKNGRLSYTKPSFSGDHTAEE
jgi:hypothetical protein